MSDIKENVIDFTIDKAFPTIVGALIIFGLFVLCPFVIRVSFMDYDAQALCLSKGYPQYMRDVHLTYYCIKRLDQTDIVVPLKEVK